MKTKFAAAALALGLAMGVAAGGLTAAAPAQAATGTSVYFNAVGVGVPRSMDLYNTSAGGYDYEQTIETTRNNVAKTCPKGENWFLFYYTPRGEYGELQPGQCLVTRLVGTYKVGVGAA